MVEALWAAGVPKDVLQLVQLADSAARRAARRRLRVDRVILTGGYETAQLFRGFRPDLRLLAETSGKNAIIVTPTADLDLAVKDVVASAFGHAGQKCSAASLVDPGRLGRQLVAASTPSWSTRVRSLGRRLPDRPDRPGGPDHRAAEGKLLDGLTTLGDGESWLVEPERSTSERAALDPRHPRRRAPRLASTT